MRKLTSLLLAAALSTATLGVLVAAPAHAKAAKPRAELVTQKVSASLVSDKVTAGATIKNKGTKKAPVSEATFYLSQDTALDRNDTPLGSGQVKKIKAKKAKKVVATFTVPGSAAPGTYHVVVCADAGGAVKERKENNNCKGSKGTVQVTGTTTGPLTVSATATAGGTVAASLITGGSCVATTCTFPTSGTGTVTFTPTPTVGYRFGAWSGATCTGFTNGSNGKITFTNPTGHKACTATFIKQITVSFSQPPLGLAGTVAAAAGNGSCTPADVVTGQGSCVVDAVTGTVTLTASAGLLPFKNWTGDCSGSANPLVLSNLSADKTCGSSFAP
jgi:CARDB protein